MTNINYEAIARENGFCVQDSFLVDDKWFWYEDNGVHDCKIQVDYSNTPEEAWKACCVENGLIEGEEV